MTTNPPVPPLLAPGLKEPRGFRDRAALRSALWLCGLALTLLLSRLLIESKPGFVSCRLKSHTFSEAVECFADSLTTCFLRKHTGFPCALCGSTRALASLSRGDFAAACGYNPVVSGAAICGLGVTALGTVRPRVFRAFSCFLRRMLRRRRGRVALLWFAILNWAYLVFAL